jgi:hypothetical protein
MQLQRFLWSRRNNQQSQQSDKRDTERQSDNCKTKESDNCKTFGRHFVRQTVRAFCKTNRKTTGRQTRQLEDKRDNWKTNLNKINSTVTSEPTHLARPMRAGAHRALRTYLTVIFPDVAGRGGNNNPDLVDHCAPLEKFAG